MPYMDPSGQHASCIHRCRVVHGAVAGEPGAQPARALEPLEVAFQVLVFRLHLPPPVCVDGWDEGWDGVGGVATLMSLSSGCTSCYLLNSVVTERG